MNQKEAKNKSPFQVNIFIVQGAKSTFVLSILDTDNQISLILGDFKNIEIVEYEIGLLY